MLLLLLLLLFSVLLLLLLLQILACLPPYLGSRQQRQCWAVGLGRCAAVLQLCVVLLLLLVWGVLLLLLVCGVQCALPE